MPHGRTAYPTLGFGANMRERYLFASEPVWGNEVRVPIPRSSRDLHLAWELARWALWVKLTDPSFFALLEEMSNVGSH